MGGTFLRESERGNDGGRGPWLFARPFGPHGVSGFLALDCRRVAGGYGSMMDYGGGVRKRFLSWVLVCKRMTLPHK